MHQPANQSAACFRKEKLSSASPFQAIRLTTLDEVPGDAQLRFTIHGKNGNQQTFRSVEVGQDSSRSWLQQRLNKASL